MRDFNIGKLCLDGLRGRALDIARERMDFSAPVDDEDSPVLRKAETVLLEGRFERLSAISREVRLRDSGFDIQLLLLVLDDLSVVTFGIVFDTLRAINPSVF